MEALLYSAQLAEQTERYSDLISIIKEVTNQAVELTKAQRDLLKVGYKNVFNACRSSWRTICKLETMETNRGEGRKSALAKLYREKIEKELTAVCVDALSLIDLILTTKTNNAEARVYFLTMQGDHYHSLSSLQAISTPQHPNPSIDSVLCAYQKATKLANTALSPAHPIRLDLILHYSVFQYEALKQCSEACNKAKEAFEAAFDGLEALEKDEYQDSSRTMLILRDYYKLWTSGVRDEEGL